MNASNKAKLTSSTHEDSRAQHSLSLVHKADDQSIGVAELTKRGLAKLKAAVEKCDTALLEASKAYFRNAVTLANKLGISAADAQNNLEWAEEMVLRKIK